MQFCDLLHPIDVFDRKIESRGWGRAGAVGAMLQAVFDGRRAAARVARTMATPTPKTVQRVMLGVTQKLPMIGEAAISRAKSHSPGALRAVGRISRSIFGAPVARSNRPGRVALAGQLFDLFDQAGGGLLAGGHRRDLQVRDAGF